MPLHHYIEQYFQQHPESRSKGISIENSPLEKRPKIFKVEDSNVKTAPQIPIRIYTPSEEKNYPLLIFFHGGDLLQGNLETHDVSCRLISTLSGYKVIAVDYQNTSAQFSDSYIVTKWIVEHAEEYKGKSIDIAIGGASIGANLAAAIVLKSIKTGDFKLSKQILYYPITDINNQIKGSEYQSRELYNAKYGLDISNAENLSLYNENEETDYISPIKTSKKYLTKMPKTLVFTAEYDPLCDEGELYAQRLKEAGVEVRLVRFDGNIHGFMQSFPGSPDYMRGYDITTEFLNSD